MLSQVERYAVLSAMGTRWWVPRYQLPAAQPSMRCDWPVPEAESRHGAEAAMAAAGVFVSPEHTETVSAAEDFQNTPPSTDDVQDHSRLAVAPEDGHEPAVETVEEVRPMAVEVWAMNNRWLWVVELDQPGLAHDPQRLTLLSAIARALHPQRIGLVAQYTLSWPVEGVPVLRGDQRELADALTAYLTGPQFSPFEPPGVMAFGERLGRLLDQDRLGRPCFSGPSLSELLSSPDAKAQLWQHAQQGLSAAFAANEVVMEA
ncbi:hypothetical protein BFW38_14190 [Terasakiispira papahanaumokuakeensis]|uniref:Uncharacterized protein n=1 Tax=Terasakiispira papahanaumokuakeensis TaxID=197479 RepID=A0A1E2VBZ5_9GAMM|nr:hypothetical protein [Terasakiispira papahanaumokuakeensis]ODC04509.1 hypothetical protein BFW38_14190 [Terasakiispira papahanaumokuakeensis]